LGEKETLGLYLTGHPIDEYEAELSHLVSSRIVNLKPEKSKQKIAGQIVAFRLMKTRRGDNMAFITLDDRSGRLEVAVFSDTYNDNRECLVKDALVVIEGQVSHDDYSGGLKMRADGVSNLSQAREDSLLAVQLALKSESLSGAFASQLAPLLKQYTGGTCRVKVQYSRGGIAANLSLDNNWKVKPDDELLQSLRSLFGPESIELIYKQAV